MVEPLIHQNMHKATLSTECNHPNCGNRKGGCHSHIAPCCVAQRFRHVANSTRSMATKAYDREARESADSPSCNCCQLFLIILKYFEHDMLKTLCFFPLSSLGGICKASFFFFFAAWANSKFRKCVFVETKRFLFHIGKKRNALLM